jgi:hypothetical protein
MSHSMNVWTKKQNGGNNYSKEEGVMAEWLRRQTVNLLNFISS